MRYGFAFSLVIILKMLMVVCRPDKMLLSSKKDIRMRTSIAVQMSSTVPFLYWLLYVWIKGSKFGSQPECNQLVKFVLLFFNVMATENWLRVFIILYALAYLGWMALIFSVILMVYFPFINIIGFV
jgi:hypothetical protein